MAGRLFVRLAVRRQIGHDHAQCVKSVARIYISLQSEIQRVVFVAAFYHIVKFITHFEALLNRVGFFKVASVGQRGMYFDRDLFRLILHFRQGRL